jgi:hypothetical protein
MGCNCKKNVRQAPQVITSEPTPTPLAVPQTPEELHAQEMNNWNGGEIKIEEPKQEN